MGSAHNQYEKGPEQLGLEKERLAATRQQLRMALKIRGATCLNRGERFSYVHVQEGANECIQTSRTPEASLFTVSSFSLRSATADVMLSASLEYHPGGFQLNRTLYVFRVQSLHGFYVITMIILI